MPQHEAPMAQIRRSIDELDMLLRSANPWWQAVRIITQDGERALGALRGMGVPGVEALESELRRAAALLQNRN